MSCFNNSCFVPNVRLLRFIVFFQFITISSIRWNLSLGLVATISDKALSLVHTSDISISNENKAWLLLWELAKTKHWQEIFLVSPFVLLLAHARIMILYAYAYDGPYIAGLTSFLCFAFCFAIVLMLMLLCEPGFRMHARRWLCNIIPRFIRICYEILLINAAVKKNIT